jgi:hypothetical protein
MIDRLAITSRGTLVVVCVFLLAACSDSPAGLVDPDDQGPEQEQEEDIDPPWAYAIMPGAVQPSSGG